MVDLICSFTKQRTYLACVDLIGLPINSHANDWLQFFLYIWCFICFGGLVLTLQSGRSLQTSRITNQELLFLKGQLVLTANQVRS